MDGHACYKWIKCMSIVSKEKHRINDSHYIPLDHVGEIKLLIKTYIKSKNNF